MRTISLICLVMGAFPALGAASESLPDLVETPYFTSDVAGGKIPPIGERIPKEPAVLKFDKPGTIAGRHGGSLRLLMGRKKDTRQLVVYGYARLIGYDETFEFVPDILKSYDVQEGRIFTFRLRKGHRWSDGHPFTAEDFRYYFEDVATNRKVSNESLPRVMLVDGRPPVFEVLDEQTIRYTWHKPNPFLLPRLAGARPIYLFRPAHYLKKYHVKYTPLETLEVLAKKRKQRNWVALHYVMGQQYKNVNPDLPSLQPWVLATRPPAKRFTFKRNSFFHRIDRNGRQLPYIDDVKLNITSSKLIPLKAGAGETDLQSRGLNFKNYTLLKRSEKQFGYSTKLWQTAKGAQWAIFPNLHVKDAEWKKIFRDVRFRRALSVAVDRHEINQAFYFGLARPSNNSLLRESPLYNDAFAKRWRQFDLELANKLLDEMGLTKRTGNGIRLLPSGKPLEITVVFSTEQSAPSDILELVTDTWRKIGIRVLSKPLHLEIMRNGIFSGTVQMSMWSGLENGIPNDGTSPEELAPTTQQQYQWPKWGQYMETAGKSGEAIDLDVPRELFRLNDTWRSARTRQERSAIWNRMMDLFTDNVFSIGLISGVPQVIVANSSLKNVPEKAIYNWDPGAHFGIYRPDTFWIDTGK